MWVENLNKYIQNQLKIIRKQSIYNQKTNKNTCIIRFHSVCIASSFIVSNKNIIIKYLSHAVPCSEANCFPLILAQYLTLRPVMAFKFKISRIRLIEPPHKIKFKIKRNCVILAIVTNYALHTYCTI